MNNHIAFLNKMSQVLHASELTDNLGLCSAGSIAGENSELTMEFISSHVNITLPFDHNLLEGDSINAAWNIINSMNSLRRLGCEWLTILRHWFGDSGIRSVQE